MQFTRVCAAAWAADNIQVNAVLPGYVTTDMTRSGQENPEFVGRVINRTAGKRWGTPDDMAGIAAFLAGAGSDFMTGSAVIIDGGLSFAV